LLITSAVGVHSVRHGLWLLSGCAASPATLHVILNNLISNALKFIIERTVTVREGASGDRYLFQVPND
jgi:signal transduction histidine kinase